MVIRIAVLEKSVGLLIIALTTPVVKVSKAVNVDCAGWPEFEVSGARYATAGSQLFDTSVMIWLAFGPPQFVPYSFQLILLAVSLCVMVGLRPTGADVPTGTLFKR